MELNGSTLLLEVINFLILVWLLKRFLYQPVLGAIEKRRLKIEADLAQAAKVQQEADTSKRQFDTRLADWETEKRGALELLEKQIEQERAKRLQQLETELTQQRRKLEARDQQQQTQWRGQAESEALRQGAEFAARLLKTLAGTELDSRLQALFIEQLKTLSEAHMANLSQGWQESANTVEVVSALPLDEAGQQQIRLALEQKLGAREIQWRFRQDPNLVAGLRVSIGAWTLAANIQDELQFFAEATRGG